jgi:integrase
LLDHKALKIAQAAQRPIGEHLDEFIASMTAANRNAQHVAQTKTYIQRVLDLGGIERTPHLAPAAVMKALGKLRDQEFSARSINARATAIKALSLWLWSNDRTAHYDLKGKAIPKLNETTDRRRVRRVLSPEELVKLIETTRTAPPWRGLPGPDRALLYAVAASTGFRRDELGSWTPASFRLDSEPPTIVCQPAYTKNREEAEQPVPETLVNVLRPWLASKAPGKPVFHPLSEKTGLMLALDLKRAGIKPMDDQDRTCKTDVVDMHSLRHTYITALAKAGTPLKTLQTLARHSDPKLTLNVYSHLTLIDAASALDALPDLSPKSPAPKALRMTGTDAASPTHKQPLAHYLPTAGEESGGKLRHSDVIAESGPQMMMHRNPLKAGGVEGPGCTLRHSEVRVGDGIRTRDTQIHKLTGGTD